MKIIKFEPQYRDDLIFMILEAKNALGRVPGLNDDLLDIQKNYIDKGDKFWIALDDNDRVIGSVGYNSIANSDDVVLHRLFVKYNLKHQGIGTALLKTVEEHLKDIGKKAAIVHLGDKKDFYESWQFYPKHGYVEYEPNYMRKELQKSDLCDISYYKIDKTAKHIVPILQEENHMGVYIRNKKLIINNREFPDFEIEKEIGSGANGHVYLAKHLSLDRYEALKIWDINRKNDKRDKTKQALLESQKLARVNSEYAIEIFNHVNFEGYTVVSMEYFEGKTLHEYLSKEVSVSVFHLLGLYLDAIEETSTINTFHGDAHDRNVLVNLVYEKYETRTILKLCDFGTSCFSGKSPSFDRHWRVVEETILNYTKHLIGFDIAREGLENHKAVLQQKVSESKERLFQGDDSLYDSRLMIAPYRDFLEYLKCLNEDKNGGW